MPLSPDDVIARRALRRLGADLCGRYSILRLVGIGGMAAVYAGVHRNGHAVAIKILHEQLSADPEIERLFRREAQLANKVGHPGVVPVIDDDVADDGCVFLVMPLLQGETLRARAERLGTRRPAEEVMVVAHAVLEVLAAAHAKKIVHRDIKPENLFLTCDGSIRLLDFGIGRFLETNESGSATRSGRALGTPAFMAPEQALGRTREVDGRTDLWALGATMFSLLSGHFVHEAESPTELAVLAATKPARLLGEVAPEVPEPLRAVVDRALAFTKEGRWGDAQAMAQALLSGCRDGFGKEMGTIVVVAPPRTDGAAADSTATQAPERPGGEVRGGALEQEEEGSSGAPEKLRAATTRTTTGGVGADAERLKHGNVARIAAGLAVLIALGAGSTALHVARHPTAFATTAGVDGGSTDGKPPPSTARRGTTNDAARDAYESGLALWHAASETDALPMFAKAASLDAEFASAHLYFAVLSPFVTTSARAHFAQATEFRDRLSAFESALLEAGAPAMEAHSNWGRSVQRLEALREQFPEERELPLLLAHRYRLLFSPNRALASVATSDSELPVVWNLRANAYAELGRLDDARSAFATCLTLSPRSTSCSQMLLQLEENDGHCTRAEELVPRPGSRD